MKHALIFGGASKNGKTIIDVLLNNNYVITNIGSSTHSHKNVNNIKINWNDLDIVSTYKICSAINTQIDFVFFNQNSSSLSIEDFSVNHNDILLKWKLIKDWTNSHWLSCQLPFLVIHTIRNKLSENAKIGWMLSSFIDYQKENTKQHPDYSSFKYFNYLSMKCFAETNNIETFGIMPDFTKENSADKLEEIINKVISQKIEKLLYKF